MIKTKKTFFYGFYIILNIVISTYYKENKLGLLSVVSSPIKKLEDGIDENEITNDIKLKTIKNNQELKEYVKNARKNRNSEDEIAQVVSKNFLLITSLTTHPEYLNKGITLRWYLERI